MIKTLNIKYKGEAFILVQSDNQKGKEGAITTEERRSNFQLSYYYSLKDGTVVQNRKKVGTHDDIKIVGAKE